MGSPMVEARKFWITFALFCVWLLGLFVGFRDLPMVDLPQHSALLELWLHWDNLLQGDRYYELNLNTPCVVTYFIALLLAPLTGAVVAWKVVAWAAVVGNALMLTLLAKRLGHSPWLGLLGFPTGLCHAYYFGFLSFLFSTQFAIACWLLALQHTSRPTLKRGLALASLLCFTLFAHAIAFCIGAMGAGFLLLAGQGRLWQRLAPFVAPVVLIALWVLPGRSTRSIGGSDWRIPWDQILDLPASLVGMYRGDQLATLGGLFVLATALLHAHRPSRLPWRWGPLLVTVAGYCLFPASLSGFAWLHARFVGFIIPALLVACDPVLKANAAREVWRAPAWLIGVCGVWLTVFGVRLARFNAEAQDFHELVRQLPSGLGVRPIVFERESEAFPTVPALLHFPAYYQVQKAGTQGYSFAIYPGSIIRFREPWELPVIPPGYEWHPELFDAPSEVPLYDCFMVHSSSDRSGELFADSPVPVTLAARAGSWWAYLRQ
jgi:hypothetical protein